MKKAGYLFLLLVLILQSGGLMLIYNMQQCSVRYEMREKLNTTDAVFEKLTLGLNEYKKGLVEENEIRFNGKMYDIKSASVTGDVVEMLVIHDIEEEEILEKIKSLFTKTGAPVREIPGYLNHLISMVYLSPASASLLIMETSGISVFHSSNQDTISIGSKIPSPPPKLA